MKRIPAYLVALILGATIYHFLAPRIFTNPLQDKTPVFAPHLYLMAIEQQRDQSTSSVNSELRNLSGKLTEKDTFSLPLVGEKINSIQSGYRSTIKRLNERRNKWASQLTELNEDDNLRKAEAGFWRPAPLPWPPPPDPCDTGTCFPLFLKDKMVVIYFHSPVSEKINVSFTNASGETVFASNAGDASQVRVNDQALKLYMDLSAIENTGQFTMNIDGHLGENISLMAVIE